MGLLKIKAGTTISSLSKKHGVSRQYAHKVVGGYHSSEKADEIRKDIASQVGLKVSDLWL